VKVETLLDVTQEGWTFAHEFAHLVERILPPAARPAESELEGCAWRCIGFQHPTFGGNVDAAPT